jgi:integrase
MGSSEAGRSGFGRTASGATCPSDHRRRAGTASAPRAELRHVVADVERRIWRPPEPAPAPEVREEATFHEFASEWLQNREPELRPKTIASYRWQLSNHLLPYFAGRRLSEITPRVADGYKAAQLRDGRLGPNQINKTLGLLGRIMKAARRYGYLQSNPLDDVDRLRQTKPHRETIEPEQLPALLDSAGAVRPILATLAGAGLRNGEACALDWRDVNLAAGTLTICGAKTDVGVRQVDVPLALREELSAHKARAQRSAPEDPVFPNRNGGRQTVSNVERRLKTVIRRANRRLAQLGIEPIEETVTPHSMRRLYASLRFALRDDPVYVADQMGHEDGAFSMRVYARAVKRRERLRGTALSEFDRALEWAEMGRIAPEADEERSEHRSAQTPERLTPSHKLTPSPDSSVG